MYVHDRKDDVGLISDAVERHWCDHDDPGKFNISSCKSDNCGSTHMKFQIQFPVVARALAGARILRGTISAG